MITEWTAEYEDQIDAAFMMQIQNEVTQSCALPFVVPLDRLPAFVMQAARYFWQNDDSACEQRMYLIKNSEFCHPTGRDQMNRIVTLPPQILGVQGCYKTSSSMRTGVMGDFSLERMMLTTYSMFGGMGSIGGGVNNGAVGAAGYTLSDVVVSMYEVSTFDQTLNAPLTYNYNMFSNKLVVLGDMGYSNILIDCWKRLRLQDLYQNYYFFRFCVCLVKRSLNTIYSTFEFKLPGGVTINFSNFKDEAESEMEEIKEWMERNRTNSYFFQPNTL